MTTFNIQKATKRQAKLRHAIIGVAGSGKTYTSLKLAQVFGRILVIDTEHSSSAKYADEFEFDILPLESYSPQTYIDAIRYAESTGKYDVLIIDSLSHAWSGTGGALEMADNIAKRSQSQNKFQAWADVTPLQNRMVEAIMGCKLHVFATLRAKQEYVIEKNEKGKSVPRKVGIGPVQKDGLEYEFDVVADMTLDTDYIVTKTRCKDLHQKLVNKPGTELANLLKDWLDGEPVSEPVEQPEPVITDIIGMVNSANSVQEINELWKVNQKRIVKDSDEYRALLAACKQRKEQLIQETEVA